MDPKGYVREGKERDRTALRRIFALLADGAKGSAEGTRRLFYVFPPSQDPDVCLDFLEATEICSARFEVAGKMASYAESMKYLGDTLQNARFERLLVMFNEVARANLRTQDGPKGIKVWYAANAKGLLNDVMEEELARNPNGPFPTLTRRYADAPDQAKVVTATFCGGTGTEWFASAAVAPDGTIVAAGGALAQPSHFGGIGPRKSLIINECTS